MTELRVTVPDEIAERLASEAADRGTSAEDVAAEVLRLHVPSHRQGTGRFGFLAIGQAKPGFSVKDAEERLEAEGFG
jgi:plasmid stability protein